MPSDYENLLAQIKATLEGIANIGQVHNRVRLPKGAGWAEFLTLFKSTIAGKEQIRGWMITSSPREPLRQIRKTTGGQHQRSLRFKVLGVMGLDDAASSEVTFRSLAETVIDTFDALPTLSGKALGSEPAQMPVFDTKNFGGVLCHYVEIDLEFRIMRQITYS